MNTAKKNQKYVETIWRTTLEIQGNWQQNTYWVLIGWHNTRFGPEGKGSDQLVQMYGDLMFTAPADAVIKMMLEQDHSLSLYQVNIVSDWLIQSISSLWLVDTKYLSSLILSFLQYIYNHQGHVSLYDVIVSKPWQLALKFLGLAAGFKSYFKVNTLLWLVGVIKYSSLIGWCT